MVGLAVLFLLMQGGPDIGVEALGPSTYRLTITVENETDPVSVSRLLIPKARALCGDQGYELGHYSFTATQEVPSLEAPRGGPGSLTLVQDMTCGRTAEVAPAALATPITDAEATALQPGVLALTEQYFAALDTGAFAEAFAMADEAMTGGQSLEDWTADARAQQTSVGALTARQVGRVTWYSNPPGTEPGIYVAVDFVADGAVQDLCGYLVWRRSIDGSGFRLTRQEIVEIPHDLSTEALAAVRRQYCILL
ncbi:MAG TPA: DUF4019 domain-containing protein [Allosphingosinicella sp.]|jgi:hypothetical protein